MSRIELIVGPMFSGKSTELLRRLGRARYAKQRVVLFKPSCDVRPKDVETIETHDGVAQAAVNVATPEDMLAHLASLEEWPHVVGIDEGQFIPDLDAACLKIAEHNIRVIVAGLSGTFDRGAFSGPSVTDMSHLLCIASSCDMLTAICAKCSNDASFTWLCNARSHDQVQIGGSEKYAALCHDCYNSLSAQITPEI